MKAVVLSAYGAPDGLVVQEVARPEPGPGQLVVRVHHTTVTAGDGELRRSDMPWLFRFPLRVWMGFSRPKPGLVMGMEVSGVVDAVGEDVEGFAVGDAVFGTTGMGFGGYAEYALVDVAELVAVKPAAVPFDQAAALPVGGLAALGYLQWGGIAPGKRVLIRGASGSIGTYAVQLAKHHFACDVTAVAGPEDGARLTALGADRVLDYTTTDVWALPDTFDVVLDVVGRASLVQCMRRVAPGGAYVRGTVPGLFEVLAALWVWVFSGRRLLMGDAGGSSEDLTLLARLVEDGTLQTVIDRRYPLEQAAEAHRYVDGGHKKGNVLLDVVRSD